MDPDEKFALLVFVIAIVVGLPLLGWLICSTEPKCPPGSQSHYSRGWTCVVPALEN
jgi:hypothetical protein